MIIFINGSINSGKTTIARLLSQHIEKSALIEVDTLREMVAWMPIKEAVNINLLNTVSLIRNFTTERIYCIVPYPISQENYWFLRKELSDIISDVHFITLSPSIEIALSNRGTRILTKEEQERIKYHYSIDIHNPSFGYKIIITKQTPEEILKEVVTLLTTD